MGSGGFLWNLAKKYVTFGLVAVTISDRYVSVSPVRGESMSPTFNPHGSKALLDDYVLVEKYCLEKYKFSRGDVVIFSSPTDHTRKIVKRIMALPGDWVGNPRAYDAVRVPEGHCWVLGDNSASSLDSRTYGPIPLGLVCGRVTHIVWPPQRVGKIERTITEVGVPF
ncbi:mitochondrial inner membrane protease subunit 2 [Impatiens glandulifera]|uniref:mitochondrial inner membrane protease subunit 2 n=1 Tax=Impatiens glandulifera TaxID=253017 RepID=UPI001FB0CD66|nr:mitochondrial inner membrane protease subunit 2 [Impatiens glandulifera]XP_047323638.1 mitochondrial inner membrane protease subunit 2 [Impatiens glandulifera]